MIGLIKTLSILEFLGSIRSRNMSKIPLIFLKFDNILTLIVFEMFLRLEFECIYVRDYITQK